MEKKENSGSSNSARKSSGTSGSGGSSQGQNHNQASGSASDQADAVGTTSGNSGATGSTSQTQNHARQANHPPSSNSSSPLPSRRPDNHSRNHSRSQRNSHHSANGVAGYVSNSANNAGKSASNRSNSANSNQANSAASNQGARSRNHTQNVEQQCGGAVREEPVVEQEPVAEDDEFDEAAVDGAAAVPPQLVLPPSPALPTAAQHGNGNVSGSVPYNWQATKPGIKERLAFMFNNDIMGDVYFIVGKGNNIQRIPAHKFVLSIGSAVFDAMFNGGMATTSAEVELPDVEPAAFLALLRFLYSDEVQIGPETVMTTLYTAKKYAVPALERACVDFLKRNLSSDNAFMLLTQARLFDEPQLAALCLETIDKNTSEALAAEGFTDIDLETLSVVLERDTLGIRECKLFNAVCRWAEAECVRQNMPATSDNKRAALGPALPLIRFPLMTVEEFAVGAAQSGILEDREVVELFLHFTVNPKPSVKFLDTPRCCLTGKEQVVSRFCQIESRWGYSGTSDRIRFMVNRRIFVVGFGLYGSIHGPAEYSVNIQIIHTDSGRVCGQNDTSFQCDGSNSTFRVMFKEPVEIHPNTIYTACATLKGPDSYYGTRGLRKVTHESVSSGKVTFQFTYAAGNNNGTSVEDGQLPEIIFYT